VRSCWALARGQWDPWSIAPRSAKASCGQLAADGEPGRARAERRPDGRWRTGSGALVALGVQEFTVAQIAMMSNSVGVVLLLLTMASHLSSFTIG
jgi:hypothetical protein